MPKPFPLVFKGLLAASLFFALVLWVQFQLGWQSVLNGWSGIPIHFIAAISLCILLSHGFRVLRLWLAYRTHFSLTFYSVAGVSLVHNTVSFLLPMRLGEAALPLLSKNQLNVDFNYSVSTLLVLRLFDAHLLFLLLITFGASAYLNAHGLVLSWIIALIGPLLLGAILYWLRRCSRFQSISKLVSRPQTLIMLYLNTALIWVVKLGALSILAQQLGRFSFNHAWVASLLADASALSPVTGFANAGTFEAAFALPLLPLGYDSNLVLSVSVNMHILILITNLMAGGIGTAILLLKTATVKV